MKTIRQGCFETNSSSTHSITMCMESDFNKWKNGEMYLCDDKLVTKEEAQEILRKMTLENKFKYNYDNESEKSTLSYKGVVVDYDNKEQLLTKENLAEITDEEIQDYIDEDFDRYEMPLTYKQYYEDLEYETYEDKFITPNGDTVVSFGYYGGNY